MQHSYDGLDHPGGFSRLNLFAPLRHRDFRLLWAGMTVSLVGDGIFLVAMAWQVYSVWNAPAALSVVGIAMTVPTIVCLLPGGVVSDRMSRRTVMLAADSVRAVAIGVLAVLSLTGRIQVWEIAGLAMCTGRHRVLHARLRGARARHPARDGPARGQLARPVRAADRPAAGRPGDRRLDHRGLQPRGRVRDRRGLVRRRRVAVLAMRRRPTPLRGLSVIEDIRSGPVFIRRRTWLWGTLVSAAFAYLLFLGPTEVLLPYVVKNSLHGSAGTLGTVFAAGGIGSIGAAVLMGQRAQPRRQVTFIYVVWTLATLAVAGYGFATATWQLVVVCLAFNALETAGTIVWATLKQRHVPASMLGRVSSLDWLISIGLLPLSFALTAPLTALLGARLTLVGAGVGGAAITLGALFLPGMRDVERHEPATESPEPLDVVVARITLRNGDVGAAAAAPVGDSRRNDP